MSQKLVSLNGDLSRLRSEGYDVFVNHTGHLLIKDVPYVNSAREVKRGIIASVLDVAGDKTIPPESHVALFVGDYPCNVDGSPLPGVSQNTNQPLGEGLEPNHQISRKPTSGPTPGKYRDYYEKMTTYIAIVSSPAQALDQTVTARSYRVVIPEKGESVFRYLDTATTKTGIVAVNRKLAGGKIAIVGAGGTGSYVLDLVSKTPVDEIHVFDGDVFLNHNAFRCPGAASFDDLVAKHTKVDYLVALYSRMRQNLIPHNCFIGEGNVDELREMSFVFLCIDRGSSKQLVVERLEAWGIPFIDVGMGIQSGEDNALAGIVTVTLSTEKKRDHFRTRVGFTDGEGLNEYSTNIQIAELNALSAALAVIKWKKFLGYYNDTRNEHFSAYMIRDNQLVSEDIHEA